MSSTAPGPARTDLTLLLSQVSHVLTTELTAALAELGISSRGHCVLSRAVEGGLSQVKLAQLCCLDKTTMVVTIDELEKAGWVTRCPSPTDRRARIIAVTEAGERVVARAQEIVDGIHDDVLAALPAGERQVFVDSLVRLVGSRLANPVACPRVVRRRSARAP